MIVIPVGMIAFSLICSGSYNTAKFDPTAHLGFSDYVFRHETHQLQLDMHTRRWCADRCEIIERIGAANADWISLSDVQTHGHRRVISIIRKTGTYFSSSMGDGRDAEAQAVCRVAPFRGFPASKG